MKLRHLFENRKYGQRYTEAEKAELTSPNLKNIGGAFIVGKTIFDNQHGKGQTPNNEEILYHGFAVEMKPSDFLKIVEKQDREEDAKSIAAKMLDNMPYGSPLLFIKPNIDEWKSGKTLMTKVVGHEGRARSLASQKINGDVFIPVHVILRGAFKRDLTDAFFNDLRKNGFIPEDSSLQTSVKLGKVWKT